jgi:hypothetical protein
MLVEPGTIFEVIKLGASPIAIVTPDGLNATDIEEIEIDFWTFPGHITLPENWSTATVTYTMSWKIRSDLTGGTIVDMGSFEVTNWTLSEQASPWHLPGPIPVNFTENNATTYWVWHIDREQIQNILPSTIGSANVSFSLDLSASVHYQITTSIGTQNGDATEQWSGNWGTLQLILDDSSLLGFRYNFPDMGLYATPIP